MQKKIAKKRSTNKGKKAKTTMQRRLVIAIDGNMNGKLKCNGKGYKSHKCTRSKGQIVHKFVFCD